MTDARKILNAANGMRKAASSREDEHVPGIKTEPVPVKHTLKSITKLPGPRGLPLLGNALQIDGKHLPEIIEAWAAKFGSLFKLNLMGQTIVVVTSPHLIRRVLKERPDNFRRMAAIEPVFKEIGIHGLFSAEGESWRRQRPFMSQALSAGQIKAFFPALLSITERLQRRLDKAADGFREIDILDDFMRYTVDVILNLSFSFPINTLEDDGPSVHNNLEPLLPAINRRLTLPFPYWRYFKLPSDRALDKAIAALRKIIDEITDKSRAQLAKQGPAVAPSNFLEAMLLSQELDGIKLSNEEIFGNILTIMVGGEDTTANTLSWVIHFLS
jgi:cytochrome P450